MTPFLHSQGLTNKDTRKKKQEIGTQYCYKTNRTGISRISRSTGNEDVITSQHVTEPIAVYDF